MLFSDVYGLDFDRATDAELYAALSACGAYKLGLRQLALDSSAAVKPSFRSLLPRLRAANALIDEVFDEMFKRQTVPWYYHKRQSNPETPKPERHRYFNFLRWDDLPSVFD